MWLDQLQPDDGLVTESGASSMARALLLLLED